MPAPPLATLGDVELLLGREIAPSEEQLVERLLAVASSAVRRFTHQTLSLVIDDVVALPSSGTALLVLAERPVIDVGDVEIESGGFFDVSLSELSLYGGEMGAFTWDAWGRLRRLDGLTWGRIYDPVTVVYSHGFAEMPAEIVDLVASKAATHLSTQETNPAGLRSISIGDFSQTFANGGASTSASVLDVDEKAVLDSYRSRFDALSIGTQ